MENKVNEDLYACAQSVMRDVAQSDREWLCDELSRMTVELPYMASSLSPDAVQNLLDYWPRVLDL